MADDIGTADLGFTDARPDSNLPAGVSPNLDALARNGISFSHGYSNSPVCSPTRFVICDLLDLIIQKAFALVGLH